LSDNTEVHQEKPMNNNMELWNQVCVSDPATVKKMTHGAKLSAIDAQTQLKRATELWGPYGMDWGLFDMRWVPTLGAKGEIGNLALEATFAVKPLGLQFPISSDMVWNPKGDVRKKLQTDTLTKALSRLGFNSDVFEGRFDDARYVEELNKQKNVTVLQEEKDKRTKNFLAAVESTCSDTAKVNAVLGSEGYESLDEINTTEKRKEFIAALKRNT
jgi:hypothetical protein